jgi:hypothetical protein
MERWNLFQKGHALSNFQFKESEILTPPELNNERQVMGIMRRKAIMKRLLLVVPMFFVITVVSFLVGRPSESAVDQIMSNISYDGSESEMRADLRHALGLDQPIHIHYLRWLGVLPERD